MDRNLFDGVDILQFQPPAAITATGNGTGIDVSDYEGKMNLVLTSEALNGTTPTLDVKAQDSADGTTYADVAGKAFAQVTDAAGVVEAISIDFNAVRKFLRIVKTVTGTTPEGIVSVLGYARKKYL